MKKAVTTSSSSSSLLLLFIIFFNCPCVINSQTTGDSCSSTPSINGISFDITNFNCLSVWESQGFILRYQQTEPDVWSFVLSAPDRSGYVGMGFSSQGSMVGSSAIVGWAGSGNVGIKQYYLGGKDTNSVYLDERNLVTVAGSSAVVSQSQRIFMAFQLNSSSQPQSKLLYAVGPQDRFPSSPNYSLTEHDYMVSTTINYLSGSSKNSKQPYSKLRRSHGVLNMVGWGILMPIGAIVARYLKNLDPFWFYAHTSIQSGGFMLGLAGVICGLFLNDRVKADVPKHKALGIVVLVLGCLQVTAFLARPDKASKVRKYWNWYHHGLGRLLFVLAVANIFYGIHLGNAGNGWNAGYGIALALLCIVAIILEIRKCSSRK